MLARMIFRSFLVTVVALLVTACAGIEGLGGGARIDQRTTHGPTAK